MEGPQESVKAAFYMLQILIFIFILNRNTEPKSLWHVWILNKVDLPGIEPTVY